MIENKRITYLDMAKGLGMVLVLCGHLQNDTVFSLSPYIQGFCRWIFSFHMPMFFIISGMLFAAKGEIPELSVFFKKRFRSIMLPYIWFSIIYFLIIIYGVFVSRSMGVEDMFLQLWYSVCMYGINVLWFLPALFFAEMIFAFVIKRTGEKKSPVFFAILTVAALAVNEARRLLPDGVPVYDRIDEIIVTLIRPVTACSFIFIGYLCVSRGRFSVSNSVSGGRFSVLQSVSRGRFSVSPGQEKGVKRAGFLLSQRTVPCFALLLLAVNIVIVKFNAPNDLRSMVLNDYLLYYIGAVAGSGFVILLCRFLSSLAKSGKAFPVLRFFGRNSLLFMAVHNNPVIWIAALQCSMFVNQFITRARGYVSYAVIILVFLIYVSVMILLINRFAPALAGRRTDRA